ncbi:hypothetical protein GC170_08970 [bacterium]|nr:hypothetical protein [bacterium]
MTRTIDGPLTSLVKAVDSAIADNKKLKSFVVYVNSDGAAAAAELEKLAKSAGIENVPLTVFTDPKGPEGYDIAKEADVTVMMWAGTKVKVNHAFTKGDLKEDKARQIADEAKNLR